MAELDFNGLRAEVEAATMLPDFGQVSRRARMVRVRARLATLSAMLGVIGMIAPVGLLTTLEQPIHQTGPITTPDTVTPVPVGLQTPPASPTPPTALQSTIVAADGTDLNHVYALVDVCAPDSCNLQLSMIQLTPKPGVGPDRIGLLRDKPTQWLAGFRVDALSQTSLVVSASPANGARRYARVNTGNSTDATTNAVAKVGDKMAPVDGGGELWAMSATSSQLSSLAHQPPVLQPTPAPVPPARGVWVVGTDQGSRKPAVAVSQDAGRSWHSAVLDLPSDSGPPVLASYNGRVAYVLARTADRQFTLLRTSDSGATWQRLPVALPWPPADSGTGYGLVVRPDGSVLAWLETAPTIVYAQSADGGHTFVNVAGPGGPIIAVSDGYVSLGSPPKVSVDGLTWANASVPILPVAR
jgi:hypothetical protein